MRIIQGWSRDILTERLRGADIRGAVRLKKGSKSEYEPAKRLEKLPGPVRSGGRQDFCKILGPKTTPITPEKNTR